MALAMRRYWAGHLAPGLIAGGVVDDEQTPTGSEGTREDVPSWWPYAAEFPRWHVWRRVGGLVYAQRPRTNPPVLVRAEDSWTCGIRSGA
jgi:hypothetical protein